MSSEVALSDCTEEKVEKENEIFSLIITRIAKTLINKSGDISLKSPHAIKNPINTPAECPNKEDCGTISLVIISKTNGPRLKLMSKFEEPEVQW